MAPAASNEALIHSYTDQPARIPGEIRQGIERSWGGAPVQLYALSDLDRALHLDETWVALGPHHVALARTTDAGLSITHIERGQLREVRELPGLSCTHLYLLGDNDSALGTLRYTHRQRRAMENIKFILKQEIDGQPVPSGEPDAIYAESMADPIREAQASVATHRLTVIWRLLGYMKPYRRRAAIGFTAAIVLTIINLLPPYLTGYLIDGVFAPVEAGTYTAGQVAGIATAIVVAIAVLYTIRQFFGWVRMRAMSILGEYVARDLRTHLYEHLQKLSLSFYSSRQTGSIISRVTSDTDRLWDFLAWGAVDFVLSVAMIIGLGGVLLWLDWRLGLIMTVPMPILFWIMMRYSRWQHRNFLRCWRKWSGMTAVIADAIPGARIVKAFNQESREIVRFTDRNSATTDTFNVVHRAWTAFWPALWLMIHMMMVGVWALAVPRVLGFEAWGPPLSMGAFVAFVLYMGMYVMPIETIGRMTFIINRATSSAHRVFEVLDTEPDIVDVPEAKRLEPLQGHVVFDNVSFAYDGIRMVLRNINFDVQPGEMVGLVGPSGAGKSTVTNLLARFYDVSGGAICVDGVDLRELDLGHYRRQLGIVLQDPHLFHGSILENIRYGVPEAELDQVVAAARAANAHDFICKLPHAYDTIVGERGHTLSGGERQRVSIARAILSNPRILILDEATSSVDTETEHKIQEALDRLIEGRTVFAVAHRLSTLRKANRLFVIEEGTITEMGTHTELVERAEGTYAKLVRMQQEMHALYVA